MHVPLRALPFALFILLAYAYANSALDTPEGPPPCGQDGACNIAACSNDPDCPDDLPNSGGGSSGSSSPPNAYPSRPEDVSGCTATEDSEITDAMDWGAENWTSYEAFLEDIGGWPVDIGNCLESRFQDNGKVVCEQSMKGSCKGANGWASALNQKCHMCPDYLTRVRGISGKSNRQACYFALMSHEFGHNCERGHKVLEIIDGEAFEFWKDRHPDVTISFSACGMS
jgi:hypothetical protein